MKDAKFVKECDIAKSICKFYITKCNGDIEKAGNEIESLQITKIEFSAKCSVCNCQNIVALTTKRPGILIGKRGETIGLLEKHLNQELAISQVRIIEHMGDACEYLMPEMQDDALYTSEMYMEDIAKLDNWNQNLDSSETYDPSSDNRYFEDVNDADESMIHDYFLRTEEDLRKMDEDGIVLKLPNPQRPHVASNTTPTEDMPW